MMLKIFLFGSGWREIFWREDSGRSSPMHLRRLLINARYAARPCNIDLLLIQRRSPRNVKVRGRFKKKDSLNCQNTEALSVRKNSETDPFFQSNSFSHNLEEAVRLWLLPFHDSSTTSFRWHCKWHCCFWRFFLAYLTAAMMWHSSLGTVTARLNAARCQAQCNLYLVSPYSIKLSVRSDCDCNSFLSTFCPLQCNVNVILCSLCWRPDTRRGVSYRHWPRQYNQGKWGRRAQTLF